MRAPIENFYEEIVDDNIDVYCCSNRSCEVQIIRGIHVESRVLDEPPSATARARDCINIYVKSVRSATSPSCYAAATAETSATGTKVYCRNCDSVLGHCSGRATDQIVFDWYKLSELWICNEDECVREVFITNRKQNERLIFARHSS